MIPPSNSGVYYGPPSSSHDMGGYHLPQSSGYMPPSSGVQPWGVTAPGATPSWGVVPSNATPSWGVTPQGPHYGHAESSGHQQHNLQDSMPRSGYADQQVKADAEEVKMKYKGILVTTNCISQVINDIRWFHLHFKRSQESQELLAAVASPDELSFLRKELGVKQAVVANIMVWRRSVMKVLLVFMCITCAVNSRGAREQWESAWAQYSAPPIKMEYKSWKLAQPRRSNATGFQHYSLAVAEEVQRLMMGQAAVVRATGSCVIVALSIISFVLCWLASISWLEFRRSRKRLILAWFLSVAAPFLVSLVPARLFVDWTRARELVDTYKSELDNELGIQAKLTQLRDTCRKIEEEGLDKVAQAGDMFEKVCGVVDKFPTGSYTIPTSWKVWKGFSPVTISLAPAHQGCAMGRQHILDGKPQEALQKAQAVCGTMRTVLDQYANDYGQAPEVLHYMADNLQHVAEASISLSLALQNLGTLFPAALSIAPGLLKGALRMKMLVPQSIIPGLFVLVLPWLYCPLTWCIYSLQFQLIGNPFLLVGLVLMAFNPIAYFMVGKWYKLAQPMSDTSVVNVINRIQRVLTMINVVAYGFLGYFFITLLWTYAQKQNFWGYQEKLGLKHVELDAPSWGQKSESKLLSSVFQVKDWKAFMWWAGITLACLISSTLRSFYLTSAAGVDWMIDELVTFRQVERSMLERASIGDDIVSEYNARMDQLLALDKNVRASVFSNKQRTGSYFFPGMELQKYG